jgi:glycerol-3-phosphate O-acyltransferase/dihydroxyacetone phosphate acyltransferase
VLVKDNSDDFLDFELNTDYEYFYIPRMDNSVLFNEVYRRLKDNACIVIFPEGTSHDRTDFIKLKAGVAHFALGAMSEFNTGTIKILPVGLNYFNRDEFRSEVIIEFGKPFEVDPELADQFRITKRQATEDLLRDIESRMKAVTLTAPSYMELRSLLLVRKLYVPPDTKLKPEIFTELCKRFAKGYEKLKNNNEIKTMMKKIHKYIVELETIGISDNELRKMDFSYTWMIRKMVSSFLLFHYYLIPAIPGMVILFPFVMFLLKKAEKERIAV